ncbi:hypothetical protein PR202_ga02007 [Eleusine coracana subsp. coracana]|uniref:Uncharacterized protein n=1 Tax=Eleusine coracana subsp. coracana TaxID=191504 RepID=A0AAV5BIB9_ELECO|nr:hypothetical protein PR202_ga01320 [Eleusine coracana subsp. coracana]GJM86174.1 hypothetical protein PR202_ga02007 [Eleusine coracana subsp. coracana]
MESPGVDMERFDAAVKSITNMGVSKETAKRVLNKLLTVYDYNWEHIEADNYQTLADAILDELDSMAGKKKRAEKKHLDSDHCNKKLKMKERGQKPKSSFHSNGKREPAEVPCQQGEEDPNKKAIITQLQKPSTQVFLKEPKTETDLCESSSALPLGSQDKYSYETPLAVMCPQIPGLIPHRASQKFKGSVSQEGNMAYAHNSQAITYNKDYSTNFEVALSNSGKGKLSFSFNSSLANHSNFRMPDIESICKAMEARCLRTYKILEPNFSFMKLLDDTCQCIIDLGSGSSMARESSIVQVIPAVDFLSKPSVPKSLRSNQASSSCMPLSNLTRFGNNSVDGVRQNNSSNMQIIQHQSPIRAKRRCHDVKDIAKGEERVRIPIITEADNEALPPPFHYIPHNITSQDAYVNLSLARIGDENCCSDCFGDCLAAPLTCACASETGGEFAYTREGLLKKQFLDACILMFQEPQNHPQFYCKICPLEKIKIDRNSDSPKAKVNPDPCKGHLIRKFIKECWRKCGCTRNCGNRVVQRGITCSLQASVLKDDEALCLDGTFYGNVARFINHRCFDGNLIGIPVEIETPDHHYYHLAFFTKRQVEPYEELTWDYEIDFEDVDHPIKAFKCRCGSEYCRDKRRISRSKSRAPALL